MAKRSDEQWQALLAQFKASGLSQSAFCKQHRICNKRFVANKKRLSNQPVPAFVSVKPARAQNAEVRLSYGAVRLELPLTPLEPTLALIKALS